MPKINPEQLTATRALSGVPADYKFIKEEMKFLKFSQTVLKTISGEIIKVIGVQIGAGKAGPNDKVFNDFEIARKIGVSSFAVFVDGKLFWTANGMPKMTGYNNSGDDDDADGAQFEALMPDLDNVKEYVFTYKECGEMFSVGSIKVGDSWYLIVGSKNRFQIVPHVDLRNFEKYIDENSELLRSIMTMLVPYFQKNAELIKLLEGKRVFGEHVLGNHVTPIEGKGYLKFFALTNAESVKGPVGQFKLLESMGLPPVDHLVIPVNDFVRISEEMRKQQQREGYVIYAVFSDDEARPFKFKALWYVVMRALREKFKDNSDRYMLVTKVWEVLGERSRSFLHLSPEELLAWRAKCMRFLHWAFQRGIEGREANFMTGGSFPELLKRWSKETDESLDFDPANIVIPEEINDLLGGNKDSRLSGKLMIFFTGKAGLGKSTLAAAVAAQTGVKVIEHDSYKKLELDGGLPANDAVIEEIRAQIATDVETIIMTISGAYKHFAKDALNAGYAIVVVNPADEMKNPAIKDFLSAVLKARVQDGGHPLNWTPDTVDLVIRNQQKWAPSLPSTRGFDHITFDLKVSYFNVAEGGEVQRVKVEEQVAELMPQIADLRRRSTKVNGKVLITADLGMVAREDLQVALGDNVPEQSANYLHGVTLAYDPVKKSPHYLTATKHLYHKVIIKVHHLVIAPIGDEETAGGLAVSVYDETGQTCLDHLVSSGVPHITVWGPRKNWRPSQMAQLVKNATPEQIVRYVYPEGTTFTARVI